MPDHYRILGVHPSSSVEQIRASYRELARRLHPDRHRDASAAEAGLAERRMREINEAWRVLQDPVTRARYDVTRQRPSARAPRLRQPGPISMPTDEPEGLDPSDLRSRAMGGLPWAVVLIVLAGIFVVSAYAGSNDGPAVSSGPSPAGTCLLVSPGPATSVVPCTRANSQKVVQRVAAPEACPAGTDPRRLASDGKVDCLSSP